MKKFFAILTLPIFISTYALADEPVCTSSERPWVTDSRFIDTYTQDITGTLASIFFDSETIKIDKKKKIIKVWAISEESEKGRSFFSEQFNGFSNYGYQKALWTIDYDNMRFKTSPMSFTNCDGSIIRTISDSEDWKSIFPSSTTETFVKKIMKKYNLK